MSPVFADEQRLEREPFAGSRDAVSIENSVRRSMGPADQICTIVAEELACPPVEWHRKVPAQIAVCNDGTSLVAKQHRQDRKTFVVTSEPRRAHDTGLQLGLVAYPNLHRAQSFSGALYSARAGTETRSLPGSHNPLSQPPYTQPMSSPTAWGWF
jgi:hypothetical protein